MLINKLIKALDSAEKDSPGAVVIMVVSLVFLFVVTVSALIASVSLLAEINDWLVAIPIGILSLMAIRYLHNRINEYN